MGEKSLEVTPKVDKNSFKVGQMSPKWELKHLKWVKSHLSGR